VVVFLGVFVHQPAAVPAVPPYHLNPRIVATALFELL